MYNLGQAAAVEHGHQRTDETHWNGLVADALRLLVGLRVDALELNVLLLEYLCQPVPTTPTTEINLKNLI
jgi:hypothetical protein